MTAVGEDGLFCPQFQFYDKDKLNADDKMFCFWLNTRFLFLQPSLLLERAEMDGACKKKYKDKFPAGFQVELVTAPFNGPAPVFDSVKFDAGVELDESSDDEDDEEHE